MHERGKKTYLNYSPCETPNGIICNYVKISNDTMPFGFEVANGKIVAEFTLNKITNLRTLGMLDRTGIIMLMGRMDMGQYENHNGQYAWHIDDLKIYNEPKELGEFGIIKAPQNWQYVKGGL